MSHPHCKPSPPVKIENVRTDIWTRVGWGNFGGEAPEWESAALEIKPNWETNAGTYMHFTLSKNPIAAWMASQYPSNQERNEQLCRHFEEVEAGCRRVMLSRTQPVMDDSRFLAGTPAGATHVAEKASEAGAPRKGSYAAFVHEYAGGDDRTFKRAGL